MVVRNLVLVLLFVTVVAPIVLYTDRLGTFKTSSSCKFFFFFCFLFLDCFKFSLSGFFLFWWFEHSLLCFTISAARDEFVEDVTTVVSSIYFSFIWKQGLFSFGYILYFNFSLTKSKSTVNYTDFEWP